MSEKLPEIDTNNHLSIGDAAPLIGVSTPTLRKMIHDGNVPVVKVQPKRGRWRHWLMVDRKWVAQKMVERSMVMVPTASTNGHSRRDRMIVLLARRSPQLADVELLALVDALEAL